MAVSVVIYIPGTLLCSRALLGRMAQRDGILRNRGALIRGLTLCRTNSRLRLSELVRVATAAGCVYCHTDSDRQRSIRTLEARAGDFSIMTTGDGCEPLFHVVFHRSGEAGPIWTLATSSFGIATFGL